jgi:hypothetical protein
LAESKEVNYLYRGVGPHHLQQYGIKPFSLLYAYFNSKGSAFFTDEACWLENFEKPTFGAEEWPPKLFASSLAKLAI